MNRVCLYMDQENVVSLMKHLSQIKQTNSDAYDEFMYNVKHKIMMHYNISKEQAISDIVVMGWLKLTAGQGVSAKAEFNQYPKPTDTMDFAPDGSADIFGIYLLNNEPLCSEIRSHNCTLIGSIGQEIEVLQKFFDTIPNGNKRGYLKDIQWKNFCPQLPLTDILICDPYYFSNEDVYRKNGNRLLYVLASIPKNFPINLVIITANQKCGCINLKDEQCKIKESIEDAGNENSNVTIICVDEHQIHDRHLITNYYIMDASGGFLKQNNIKGDLYCDIFASSNPDNIEQRRNPIIKYYDDIVKYAKCFIGDRVSNIIDIP